MINTISENGNVTYGLTEFVCDFESDIAQLPTNLPAGSSAIVIETGKAYMLNSLGKWVAI